MRHHALPRSALPRSALIVLPVALLACALAGTASAKAPAAARDVTSHAAKPAAKPAPAPPVAAAPAPPPPYEPALLQLAELSGTIAYLRGLCHDPDAPQWRARIAALIESTAQTPAQRRGLIGAFNRGYGSYALTYHRCTANARVIIDRSIARSQAITTTVSEDYGVEASD